jgi:uncharacterized membrane protein YebE (DUF533 family)
MKFMNTVAKAIVAAAATDGHITAQEYVIVITGTIIAFFGVYATTNADQSKL